MKKIALILLCFFAAHTLSAQTDGITYQAVIIDMNVQQIPGQDIPSNNLPNQPLEVRFSIFNDAGSLEYQETQRTETDPFGMIHLTIGQGTPSGASFDEIYWIDEKTLQVEINLNDGNGFVNFSNQQLTYIPYVKHREIIATSTLDVDGETNLNSSLSVNNQSPTLLTGTLTVDGETNINSDLTVNNQATTLLTGDLFVEGAAFFQDGTFVNLFVTENTEMNVVDIFGNTTIQGLTLINGETQINNTFSVINENPSILTGTLHVDGISDLNAALNVNNNAPTNFSGTLNVDGITTINNNFNVTNNANSLLTGNLQVDGTSNLNAALNVNNTATTTLSGDLIVQGTASFADATFDNLAVNQNTDLNTLEVQGISVFRENVFVNNTASTFLSGTLSVEDTSTFNENVIINSGVFGSQFSLSSYPLRISGSNQGIAVTVNGTANNASNYMLFRDNGGIRGAIEGQSATDALNSFEYDYLFRTSLKEIAFITAEGVACGFQLDFGEAGLMAAEVITEGIFDQEGVDYIFDNRGVYFKSGGADYAEYLPKKNLAETFKRGDVVGVDGGFISKNTVGASKIMVISSNPIVLGNMQDEDKIDQFEKVAFLGQVPVKVYGKVAVGDYILASGNNDGAALAKHPDAMKLTDYKYIVGVAWEASKSSVLNYINTAVGINQNDLSQKFIAQQKQLDEVTARIEKIERLLQNEVVESTQEILNTKETATNQTLGDEDKVWTTLSVTEKIPQPQQSIPFQEWLAQNKEAIIAYTNKLKKLYQDRVVPLEKFPKMQHWLENPISTLQEMEAGTFMPTLWSTIKSQSNIK